jgi:hypothetical protein
MNILSERILAILAVLLFSFGSPNAALAAGKLDIMSQSLAIDLTDDVTAIEITLVVKALTASTGLLTIAPGLPIVSVTVDGKEGTVTTPYPQYPHVIEISFGKSINVGTVAEIKVAMVGELGCSSGPWCMRSKELTYFLPYWGGMNWYLLNGSAEDPFTASLEVTVPGNHYVAAWQGSPTKTVANSDGTKTWVFSSGLATEWLHLYAGDVVEVASHKGVDTRGLFPRGAGRKTAMTSAAELASELGTIYGDMWQFKPTDRIDLVVIPRHPDIGGIGMLGAVFLSEMFLEERLDRLDQAVAHELAHTWWGNWASGDSSGYEYRFFHESFSEYSAWRALGKIRGEDVRNAGNRMNAVFYMYRRPQGLDVAILDPDVSKSPAMVHAIYHKGATVLRTFEEFLGKEAFTKVGRNMQGLGLNGLNMSTFSSLVKDEIGEMGATLINQWLKNPGFPQLKIQSEVRKDADGYTLSLTVLQQGDYALQIPLSIVDAAGRREDSMVEVGQDSVELKFEARPILVQVDPHWTMVREVRPAVPGDVSLDGQVDGVDLIEVALRNGDYLPGDRRLDGSYDPLYDLNGDYEVSDADLKQVIAYAVE